MYNDNTVNIDWNFPIQDLIISEKDQILPNLEKLVEEMICIPCGWWVTNEEREYIVDSIKKGW
jgi:hypothetical protein